MQFNLTKHHHQQNSSSGSNNEGLYDTTCQDMTIPQYISSRVLSVVSRALSNRVKLISSTVRDSSKVDKGERSNHGNSTACWDRQSKPIDQLDCSVVTIGMYIFMYVYRYIYVYIYIYIYV